MDTKVMLIFILNKVHLLDELLVELNKKGIGSATMINATGMMQQLASLDTERIIATLRPFITSNHSENKLLFTILDETDVDVARAVIGEVVGDLSKPETGILFTLPVLFTEGIRPKDA